MNLWPLIDDCAAACAMPSLSAAKWLADHKLQVRALKQIKVGTAEKAFRPNSEAQPKVISAGVRREQKMPVQSSLDADTLDRVFFGKCVIFI